MTTTFQRLQAIVANDYKLDLETIRADSSLESMGIDSLGVAELLFNIEDEFRITLPVEPVLDLATLGEFRITLPVEPVLDLATLGDVARFIDTLIAAEPAPSTNAALIIPAGSAHLT